MTRIPMIIMQLEGLDGAIFGIPFPLAVSIGGVIAFAIGIFIRFQVEIREDRRDPFQLAIDWFRDEVTGGQPERFGELVIDTTPDDEVEVVRRDVGKRPDREAYASSRAPAYSDFPSLPEER